MNGIFWEQTGDRRTWRAARGQVVLTVTKVSNGMFRADVEGLAERSPEFAKRTSAQRWAEQRAEVAA
ncbi:MAG: hypothetical protein ACRDNS_25745 [Trebonia sp.]